jgi:hypothetical protein
MAEDVRMTFAQKIVTTVLPEKWSARIRGESQRWQVRCCTCGEARPVWDAGFVRWAATSAGKRIAVYCSFCRTIRMAAVEKSAEQVDN